MHSASLGERFMNEEEYYIWKAKVISHEIVPARYERLHGVGEPFLTVLAACQKIAELKETPEFKEAILQISDRGGFLEYQYHVQNAA